MTEETLCEPINHYGASKLAGEVHVRSKGPELPWTIVRPGPIYGPRDTQTLTLFKLAARGLYIKLGLGQRHANFCHAADVVRGVMLAATRPEAVGQTFFVSDTHNYTLEESGRMFTRALRGRPGFPLLLPVPAAYAVGGISGLLALTRVVRPDLNLDRVRMLTARGWAMDTTKIQCTLGYVPRYDLESGTVQTVQWYREQGWM
jgi:nucleoside-diphosphate-sugar epimerase